MELLTLRRKQQRFRIIDIYGTSLSCSFTRNLFYYYYY